mmetsp:Transcript_11017/g.27707  ORF Transcript_11017/g.27707 Transcript_11017/m.27707 type:complete len:125 (+) Transcript_11017:710-1084(+)
MMSRRGMICMGLYRRETHEVLGNRMPYVYTNPPHEAAINNGDLAFVMCSYMPEDSCMQTDSNSQGLLLHGQEVVTKRQKGSLVRCSSSKSSMLQVIGPRGRSLRSSFLTSPSVIAVHPISDGDI